MEYSSKFRARMVSKLLAPDGPSAAALSREVGVSQPTLSRWLREARLAGMDKPTPQTKTMTRRWSPADKVRVVMEVSALSEADRGAYLRREGLHDADLEQFRTEVMEAAAEGFAARSRRGLTPEQKENRRLKRELARKDKALAETAALLVLRGKWEAFLAEGGEGDSTGKNGR